MTGYETGDDNQLTSDGTWDYSYDDEGNLTGKVNIASGQTWTYGYDHHNHLVLVEERDNEGVLEMQAEYKYDVFGNRIEKVVDPARVGSQSTQVTRFALDGWKNTGGQLIGNEAWDVWADLDSNGSLTTRYVHGDAVDQLLARQDGEEAAYWYLTDH
jgi:YD repeat-containing protein